MEYQKPTIVNIEISDDFIIPMDVSKLPDTLEECHRLLIDVASDAMDDSQIDGGHHLRYALCAIFKKIVGEESYDKFVKDLTKDDMYGWDEGIDA